MLRDIIYALEEAAKTAASDAGSRKRLLSYINRAAADFYYSTDLPKTVFEQYFETDESAQCISLPWYVEQVRAARRHLSRTSMTIQSLTPRYSMNPWRQPYDKPRILRQSALHTPLSVESQLTVTVAQPQSIPFKVAVIGQTPAAATIREVLTFNAGDLTKTTTAQFAKDDPIGVDSISKDEITSCDVVVTDGGGVEVCTIPNRYYTVNHCVLMVNDDESGNLRNTDNIIELLYRRPFTPLYYDEDQFIMPSLEEAIIWKARSYVYGLSKDQEAVQQALLAEKKANDLAKKIIENLDLQTDDEVTVAPNPYERAYQRSYYLPWGANSDSMTGYMVY